MRAADGESISASGSNAIPVEAFSPGGLPTAIPKQPPAKTGDKIRDNDRF